MSTTKYLVVSENEHELKKKETVLSSQDAEELLEYQDVFLKFLDKARFAYQIELSKGTYRGEEEYIYNAINVIDELKDWLKSIEWAFKERNKKK